MSKEGIYSHNSYHISLVNHDWSTLACPLRLFVQLCTVLASRLAVDLTWSET